MVKTSMHRTQCLSYFGTMYQYLKHHLSQTPSVKEKERRVSYKYRAKINATGTGSSKFFDRVELTFACTASHVNVNPEFG